MSKYPAFLHLPSPASYPPPSQIGQMVMVSGQGRDPNHWINIQPRGRLDETLVVDNNNHPDFSLFLNQPDAINPFLDSKPCFSSSNTNTQVRTRMYVQDSGVVLVSSTTSSSPSSGLPRKTSSIATSSQSKSKAVQNSRDSTRTHLSKPAQSSAGGASANAGAVAGAGAGAGAEIEDDWEVVYPDN